MKKILALACLLGQLSVGAQTPKEHELPTNLVPNPSFENLLKVPCGWIQKSARFERAISNWTTATETHPDVITTTVEENCWSHPKKNSNGKEMPRSGASMVGIKTYGLGKTPTFWREYVQVELKEELVPGTKYYLEFYALRATSSLLASNKISAALSPTEIRTGDRLPPLPRASGAGRKSGRK